MDLNNIRTKWFDEHEKHILTTQNELERLVTCCFRISFGDFYLQIIHLFQSITDLNKSSDHDNTTLQQTTLFQVCFFLDKKTKSFFSSQRIHNMCIQHGHEIRQLLETKLHHVFSQIRDEYDQQCGHLLATIERDINQMNIILQDINSKFDSSPLIINDSISLLIKQSQRLDVLIKNLEYDWQMMTQTSKEHTWRNLQANIFFV